MESKQDINDFEQALRTDLHQYLLSLDKVDERLPEAPDIEGLWPKIGESYLPDGMREFAGYPTVSLGWMMFLGMAIENTGTRTGNSIARWRICTII